MYPVERRKAILEILDHRGSVAVEELSKTLFTGEATVRRDLDRMAKEGIITRTHGGAVKIDRGNIDYPLAFRESENARVKDALCEAAAELVSDGQSIFLDGSSTVMRLIPKIAFKKRLKIVTNGVKTAYELSQAGLDSVVCTGGTLSVASASLTGADTVEAVRKFNADLFFFSCRAVSGCGLSESTQEVAEVKNAMAEHAKKNVLLVDSAKFGKTAFCNLAVLPRLDYVITDAGVTGEIRALFEKNSVRVLVV